MCLCRCSQSFTLKSHSHSAHLTFNLPGVYVYVGLDWCPPDHMLCCSHCLAALFSLSICSSYHHLSSKPGPKSCSSSYPASHLTVAGICKCCASMCCAVSSHPLQQNYSILEFELKFHSLFQTLDRSLASKFIFLLGF